MSGESEQPRPLVTLVPGVRSVTCGRCGKEAAVANYLDPVTDEYVCDGCVTLPERLAMGERFLGGAERDSELAANLKRELDELRKELHAGRPEPGPEVEQAIESLQAIRNQLTDDPGVMALRQMMDDRTELAVSEGADLNATLDRLAAELADDLRPHFDPDSSLHEDVRRYLLYLMVEAKLGELGADV